VWCREKDLHSSKDGRDLYVGAGKRIRTHKLMLYLRCLCSKDSKDAFNFLVKYLSTFGKDEASSAEAKEGAARAAVDYIKAPDAFQVRGLGSGSLIREETGSLGYGEGRSVRPCRQTRRYLPGLVTGFYFCSGGR
jgi:hypothetical protein